MNENWGKRLLGLILPIIVYEVILFIVQLIWLICWTLMHMDSYFSMQTGLLDQALLMQDLTNVTFSNALLMQTVGAVPAALILLHLFRKDAKKSRFSFDCSSVAPVSWLLLLVLSAALSVSGNCFLNIGDLAASSEGFERASEILFSGSVLVQFIGIGFVIPICEELLFRGVIYMRMRQYLQVNIAIFVSALIFGIIHGNIVQMIYAFIMGMLFAWFYEKFGSLFAPLAAHITANLTALGLSAILLHFETIADRDFILTMIGLVFSLIVVILLLYLNRTVHATMIYSNPV